MLQKKRCISTARQYFLGLVTVVGVWAAIWCQSFVSLADSTGTVSVGSAKIREKADITSEPVGSVSQGDKVTIRDEVQDDSGTLWYQVYINADTTGYIRSDLVSKQDGDNAAQNTNNGDAGSDNNQGGGTSNENPQPASGASVEPDSAVDAQYAAVSVEAINVRKAPSTREGVVDRLTKDAQVIVSGQSNGSDGKVWYYVTFTGTDGAEKTGFIRSDLLTMGDMVPAPEEAPEPQEADPEPAKPMNKDYEVTWEQDEDGSYVWYLYDYTEGQNGYRQKLQPLLDAAQAQDESEAADTKTLVRQRVVIVVMIVLIVLLIAAIIIMALKLRDVYYEEYEDEEEEEQEEAQARGRNRAKESEETQAPRRRRTEEAEATQTPRKRRTEETEESSARRRRRTEEAEESSARRRRRMEDTADEDETEHEPVPVNSSPKRKTKNFLLDDDEFEFEFLNMDDKD